NSDFLLFIVSKEECCPSGWVQFKKRCYLFSNDEMDWDSSANSCTAMGSHLVVMDSADVEQFKFNRKKVKHSYWIGLSDITEEGTWRWVDGTPYTSLQFWYQGEPNNDCVEFRYYSTSSGKFSKWNDVSCTLKRRRICEKPSVRPLS
uniref:C-type lectin domain-containing protein n=1 Tax=Latimeria chalumnae TaxID=7897 RepID=H2ZVM1_LATCH